MKSQLLMAVLLGFIWAQPIHAADQDQDQDKYPAWQWPYVEAHKKAGHFTYKPAGKTAPLGQTVHGPNSVNVCLYRATPNDNPLKHGELKTRIGDGPELCAEKLIADLDARVFYPDFDNIGPGIPKASSGEPGIEYLFDCTVPMRGYSPCNSIFYVPPGPSFQRYRMPTPDVRRIVRYETKMIETLENLITERQIARQLAYTTEFGQAKSLESIAAFENRYKGNDPDNLIPKLEPLKLQLQTKQYQDRFAAAKSSAELQSFIADYESKDQDRLIPESRKRLAVAVKLEQVERDRIQREQVIAQKHAELGKLESRITNCNRMTAQANRAIAREREIGAVSGYVNTSIMREAGEYIVACRDVISDTYAEYRKSGGTKSLSELK